MKQFSLMFFILIGFTACTPKAIDSNTKVSNKEAKNLSEALEAYESNILKFETLETTYKTAYNDGDKELNVKATVRIKKDEKIWISASLFGFEGVRVLVTPTRVQAMNRIEKTYYDEPVEKLQEIAGLPIDFETLQNLLIGQILIFNENDASFIEQVETVQVATVVEQLVNTIALAKPQFVLEEQLLRDKEKDLTMNVTYGNYQLIDKKLFPYDMKIQVEGEKNINIEFEAQKVNLNTNPKFDYSVNKRYKKKEIN